jgi:DNA-binding SARP family transcriptional activator
VLYLRVLGEPRITLSGTPIHTLSAVKSRALLFYLASAGRTRARSALAAMLWGDTSDQRAQVSLRQALHQLRLALPGYIVSTRTEVGIDPLLPLTIDARRFVTLAQAGLAGDHAALAAAAALYHGEFLRDFVVPDAPGFEEWLLHEREWLHGLAFQCVRLLSAQAVRERRIESGFAYTRRWLELEPWQEEAHQHLIQSRARTCRSGADPCAGQGG